MERSLIALLLYTIVVSYCAWAIWYTNRPTKNRKGVKKAPLTSAVVPELDTRFSKNAEFCPYCLTSDYWYRGGGSWSPDRCPNHPTSDDFILWKQMTLKQRNQAAKKMNEMWKEQFGKDYFV